MKKKRVASNDKLVKDEDKLNEIKALHKRLSEENK